MELLHRAKTEYKGIRGLGFTDALVHLFCFISVLFIGADKWGINVGVNFRLDQVFLLIFTALLIVKNRYRLTSNYSLVAFLIFSLISVFTAFNLLRGALFYFSIIYNVFFLFYAFENYVRFYGMEKFISILRKTLYLQFVILLIQYALKVGLKYELSFLPAYGEYMGIPRFNLWFYEPSYMATYLSFWLALSAYKLFICGQVSYVKDVMINVVMLIISTSTAGFIAIALVLVLVYVMWLAKGISKKKVITLLIIVVAIVGFCVVFSDLVEVFIGRLFGGDLDGASGGRIQGWSETFEIFLQKPLFGVGPGNYGLFVYNDAEIVPTNVTLELMATLGIFSTIAFYSLTYLLIKKARKLNKKLQTKQSKTLVAIAFALLIFTIILQFNQGYLRLYHWLILGVLSGGIKELKSKAFCQIKEKQDTNLLRSKNV